MPYTGKAAQAAQAAAQTTHGTGDSHHQWRPAGGCCAHHLQILSNFNGQAQKGPRNACGTNLRRVGPSEPSIGWKNAQQQHNSATDHPKRNVPLSTCRARAVTPRETSRWAFCAGDPNASSRTCPRRTPWTMFSAPIDCERGICITVVSVLDERPIEICTACRKVGRQPCNFAGDRTRKANAARNTLPILFYRSSFANTFSQ
mmetsp:Transcript_21294/g.44443  ORF Transcript_21294/g.44443 Transcript_21294/m.44443 type:complete len:202 (-) Transcript_21294:31-636(-)